MTLPHLPATMAGMTTERTPPQDLGHRPAERDQVQDLGEIARSLEWAQQQLRQGSPALEEIGRNLSEAVAAFGRVQGRIGGMPRAAVSRETRPVLDQQHASSEAPDPHLAERLHQLRRRLSLSVNDMAQRLGLWGANGADNLRQMERCARPLPGTLQVLLAYMEQELGAQDALDRLAGALLDPDTPHIPGAREFLGELGQALGRGPEMTRFRSD